MGLQIQISVSNRSRPLASRGNTALLYLKTHQYHFPIDRVP